MIEKALYSTVSEERINVRESAFMDAIYILNSLTQGKTKEQIAEDFNNNIEMVFVWIDYLIGINFLKNINGKWIATEDGERQIAHLIDQQNN